METMNALEREISDLVVKEIESDIKKQGYFCDSDRVEDNKDGMINMAVDKYEYVLSTDIDENQVRELVDKQLENYKLIIRTNKFGDVEAFYIEKSLDLNTVEEIENYFGLGE